MNRIDIARAIATIAHRGQVDKGGNPYIGHPTRVAAAVQKRTTNEDAICAAWLHDVVEDTDISLIDLEEAGMSPTTTAYVGMLTRTQGQPPEDYYAEIKKSVGGALVVKEADIADNLSPERLALLDDATIVRLTRKSAKARLLLGLAKN
jgi:hypothetical protein